MGLNKYIQVLRQLLPPGDALEGAITLEDVLKAIAEEPLRIESRSENLLNELDPRTCYELLAEWEDIFSLPQDYADLGIDPSTLSLDERRKMLHAKWIEGGGQSIPYLKQVALALGYEIEIEEYRPFQAGSSAGDLLYDDDRWPHTFGVLAPDTTVQYFSAGSGCAGDPLARWGNSLLEWKINKIKPAHSTAIFKYGT